MKELILTQGKVALVDDEDYEYLSQWKWFAHVGKGKWYAIRNQRVNGKANIVYLHREIMKPSSKLMVDHIDHDGLNCQRHNMRLCTQSQNMRNSRIKEGNFKRVGRATGAAKYTAQITIDGNKYHLGSFETAEGAAFAYNLAASKYFGEYAHLNKLPNERRWESLSKEIIDA